MSANAGDDDGVLVMAETEPAEARGIQESNGDRVSAVGVQNSAPANEETVIPPAPQPQSVAPINEPSAPMVEKSLAPAQSAVASEAKINTPAAPMTAFVPPLMT